MKRQWYENLVGKEITVHIYGKSIPAYVVEIDYWLGFSIQSREAFNLAHKKYPKNTYLICYRGPSSPQRHLIWDKRENAAHRQYMTVVARMLRKGYFDRQRKDFERIFNRTKTATKNITANDCAFS